jgi:ElaB/YqjD/DUF883 family membrane-anchored ribosome-binding protein
MSEFNTPSPTPKDKLIADVKLLVADADALLRATTDQASERVAGLRTRLHDNLKATQDRLTEFTTTDVERTTQDIRSTLQKIADAANQAVEAASEAAQKAEDSVKKAAGSGKDAAQDAAEAAREAANKALNAVMEIAKKAKNVINK